MSEILQTGRVIHKRGDEGAVIELLRSVFLAELLWPSKTLWLVSPWISDVPVLDNRLDGFRHVEPLWPRAVVRLGSVLVALADRGARLVIATRPTRAIAPDEPSRMTDRFIEDLARRLGSKLVVHRDYERIHTKGLVGDRFVLSGSMNFTYAGVNLNDELLRYSTDPTEVAEMKIEFRALWHEE